MSTRPRVAHVATIDLSLRFLLLDQMKAQRDAGFDVSGISAPGPWTDHLEQEGIRHIPWQGATRSWSLAADARAALELARILRRERFDIVHTHNTKPGIVGRVAARLVGVPCVVNTVHGLYASADDRLRKKVAVVALERIAAAASDLELYQSAEDLQWARRIGLVGRTRSLLLGNGIDLARFDAGVVEAERRAAVRRQLGIPEDALVVGTVARLVAKKGIREFFSVASELRASRPDVRFVAVGGADAEKGDAVSAAEIERARDSVVITGWLEDARDLIAIMDVFVLASWWGEGKPRSAMEAAALGRPLVVTDVRGCREVVRDGVDGLVVAPRDARALRSAIERLLDEPDLRARFGFAAARRAREHFDQQRVFELVVREYRRLLVRGGLGDVDGPAPRLRPARAADAAALARLHREALPGAFLPTLGEGFLRRLYRAIAKDGNAVCIVAETDEGVVGFASGMLSSSAFSRRFYVRHAIPALLAAGPRLARPSVVRGMLENVRFLRGGRPALPEAEIASVAVAPGSRGHGLASRLADAVLGELTELGAGDVRVLVGAANTQANRLYERLGLELRGQTELHRGVASNVWVASCRS